MVSLFSNNYLQKGCSGYVAYVMDTWEEGKVTVGNVPIAWEYQNAFPEDLPGVPPKRQVEF